MKRIKRSLLAISAIFGVGSAIASTTQNGDYYVKNAAGQYQLISATAYFNGTCMAGGTICAYLVQTSALLPSVINTREELRTLMQTYNIISIRNTEVLKNQKFVVR